MDLMHAILALLALAGLGTAAWMAVRQSRIVASAATDRALARNNAEQLASARDELEKACKQVEDLREQNQGLALRITQLEGEIARAEEGHRRELEKEREVLAVRLSEFENRERALREMLTQAEQRLREAFESLSGKSLKEQSERFLQLAREHLAAQQKEGQAQIDQRRQAVEQLVKPIAETLQKTEARLGQIEKSWAEDKGRIAAELSQVNQAHQSLRTETARLVKALREPNVRGRYGEIQLRKVAEIAGMRPYCDFAEQESTRDADGNNLRPDMIVRLPNGRELVVDAKANLKPYLDALEADDPEQARDALRAFADGVASQISRLAAKRYWKQYDGSPEFVVMFMPGDQFVDAALAHRPDLLEWGASQRVLLASPSTMIALLYAVHHAYQEQRIAEEARELQALGAELLDRFRVAIDHMRKLGQALNQACERFNELVGSYQHRIEPTLRRFEDAGVRGGRELPDVAAITTRPRPVGQLTEPQA